jgi:ubiquitin carboxyl-terminal hydrolase 4/11
MGEKRMREGSIWYLFSMKWFSKWQKYVQAVMGGENPGKVDNSDILVDLKKESQYLEEKRADSLWQNTFFQRDIAENRDYLLVNEDIWEFFVGIYGCEPD